MFPGMLAKKAVESGLSVLPYIKTSLSPGSGVESGVIPYLEKLGFDIVGYGCMTCIGNSGPIDDNIANTIEKVYEKIQLGSSTWQTLDVPRGKLYGWDPDSTYIKRPPFFDNMTRPRSSCGRAVLRGKLYDWDPDSTYIKRPPFFDNMTRELPKSESIVNARVLLLLGDSVTTDHISPAGSIARNSPAARYLAAR
ncbi:Iron regulatory protein 1, partial [Operophtera brumata]